MSHPKPRAASLTLADAQIQFQKWRSNKSAGEKIPEALWAIVADLLSGKSYKPTNVRQTLGISTRQFRNKFPEQFNAKSTMAPPATPKKPAQFVQAPLNALLPVPQSAQLMIERPNGTKLIFSDISQEQFCVLLKTFME